MASASLGTHRWLSAALETMHLLFICLTEACPDGGLKDACPVALPWACVMELWGDDELRIYFPDVLRYAVNKCAVKLVVHCSRAILHA